MTTFDLPRQAKMISDPVYGSIEIAPVLPIVETYQFQALTERRQLGLSTIVFPSAGHTRFAHSIGSYHATRGLADRLIKLKLVTEEEGFAMCLHALLHDIGHPAFSHMTEDFCPFDHKKMTIVHVENIKGAVEACGGNHELLMKLVRHEHPLWTAVGDKNIGMEKLDYLERDGISTVRSRPLGIDALRNYIYFLDGSLCIDAKASDFAIHTQNFYMEMYKNVYFRKSLVIAQRMFQKMVHHLIVAGELDPLDLYAMTDFELMAKVITSHEPAVTMLYDLLRRRELFKETIVLRPKAFAHETRIVGKPIRVYPLSEEDMRRLTASPSLQKDQHATLEKLEDKIAALMEIPQGEVLLVPVFNPERFQAQDVNVLYGDQREIQSLREMRPSHFAAMEETARSYTALRICTLDRHRAYLSSPEIADRVVPLLFSA